MPKRPTTPKRKPAKRNRRRRVAVVLSTEAKINAVLKQIIRGDGPNDVYAAIAKKYPKDNAQDLVNGVMAKLRDAADFDQDIVIGWCFEATREVYRKMIAARDYTGALRAIKQVAEIAKHVPSSPSDGSAAGADHRPAVERATPSADPTPPADQLVTVVRSEAGPGSSA